MIVLTKMQEHIARALWESSLDGRTTTLSWDALDASVRIAFREKAIKVVDAMMADGTMPITRHRLYDPNEDQHRG